MIVDKQYAVYLYRGFDKKHKPTGKTTVFTGFNSSVEALEYVDRKFCSNWNIYVGYNIGVYWGVFEVKPEVRKKYIIRKKPKVKKESEG